MALLLSGGLNYFSYFWRHNRDSISFLRQLLTWVSFTSPESCSLHILCSAWLKSLGSRSSPSVSVLVPSSVPSAACTQCMFPSLLLCYQVYPFPCMGLNQGILATLWKQGMSTCLAQAPGETGLRWRLGRRTALLLSWHRVRKRCSCWLLCFLNLLDDITIDLGLCRDD